MGRASLYTYGYACTCALALLAACSNASSQDNVRSRELAAWTPLAVDQDPLVRMPGTQPGQVTGLEAPTKCLNCHAGYNNQVEPGFNWKGSMMAQSARDFLFWAAMTVAGQDSIWAVGRPNAMDICERCHFPKGWLEGRSDPTNASLMAGADYDGVQCDFCHTMVDPFFETTFAGTREGNDWVGYWDETNQSSTPSQAAAAVTRQQDIQQTGAIALFNGNPFFDANNLPHAASYTESGGGQYFVSSSGQKRASFADAGAKHQMLYSRFHKSRYFCSSCHDVSNPALANLSYKSTVPGDNTTVLPTEQDPAHAYYHVERTFSEFMLSAYGQQGGAAGIGPFAPSVLTTSSPGNLIARCQDCHMRDVSGVACDKASSVNRPSGSTEHPKSGQPLHDMTGGNIFVSTVLASTVPGSPGYDATNATLLGQGAAVLTLDLAQGVGIDAVAMLAGVDRAKQQLKLAASIQSLSYDATSGALSFRVQNQTGHKLISGFPEGRRMWVNVRVYNGSSLVHQVNPYDTTAGTLRGLPSGSSPPLGANEVHADQLIYEMHPTSALTTEAKTFHFVLATGRYKDNRIPPKGFQIAQATARQVEPYWSGAAAPGHFTAQEYAGGYDQVSLTVPAGADQVVVSLYYQTTSREYVEFLRDEIKATPGATTLPQAAYVVQSDPFFAGLKAWGDTLWQLWDHNKNLPGAAPFLMAQAQVGGSPCAPPVPTLSATPASGQITLTWSDEHTADTSVLGYKLYYDQQGKSQLVAQLGTTTGHTDSGLTDGQTYCYKVTSLYAACESAPSNVSCAVPTKKAGTACSTAAECASGYCVDGMCCDTACGGGVSTDCQACSLAAGGAQDGVCGPVASGAVCRPAAGPCDLAETCSGLTTSCPPDALAPDGTPCPGGLCAGGACLPAPDAGLPAPDAGLPAPDAGLPDQGAPLPDQGAPLPDQGPGPDQTLPSDQGTPPPDQGPGPDQALLSDQGASPDQALPSDQALPDQGPDQPAIVSDQAPSDVGIGLDAGTDQFVGPGPDATASDLPPTADRGTAGEDGCSCRLGATPSPAGWLGLLGLLALAALRRRR